MKRVCIGGTNDGELIDDMGGLQFVEVLKRMKPLVYSGDLSKMQSLETELYRRETIEVPGTIFVFYVEHRLGIEEAVRTLILGYKPNAERTCADEQLKTMQNKNTPTDGLNSAQTTGESALRDAACSVFLVICATDYGGDNVEGVFLDREKAKALRDKLNARKMSFQEYRAEEWSDGERAGDEI